MDVLKGILVALGVSPAIAGFVIVLAIGLRYARGMVSWLGSGATYGAAVFLGGLGAVVSATPHQLWQEYIKAGAVIAVSVLVLQKALEKAAPFVPWLPQDNQWAKKPTPTQEPAPTQEG